MKKLILALTLLALSATAMAQTSKLSAQVVDATTKEGIIGAVVALTPTLAQDESQTKYYTTGSDGSLTIAGIAWGEYVIKISFLGYEELQKEVKITSATTSLGRLELTASDTKIETVVKEVKAIRTSQKGDTVSYNADAFKVAADADVEGLLKKMPGITIKDGAIEAQGESVKKIFVDGKEFFGEDVSTAIKALPAESVQNIEVYNKLSDNAEFSGMDDGEGYKAINIVTKSNMRQGVFGQLYAGYGYQSDDTDEISEEHKYMAGGNVNIFQNRSRLTLTGNLNNVNKRNFNFQDILGVSGGGAGRGGGMGRGVGSQMGSAQGGVANIGSIGANLTTSWGANDKFRFEGSYFYNRTNTKNLNRVIKWYEAPSPIDTLTSESLSSTLNNNHRFNAKFDWDISQNQSLMSRTNFSFQGNDPLSNTLGEQQGESGYNIISNYNDSKNRGYNFSEFLQYRAKLGKAGRTITVDGNITYMDNSKNDSRSYSNLATTPVYDNEGNITGYSPTLRYLYTTSPSTTLTTRANLTYTEPLAQYTQLAVQYGLSYNDQERDKRSYIANNSSYDITGVAPDTSLSNTYSSQYTTHRVGPGIRYSKNGNTLVANVFYQYAVLDGVTQAEQIKRTYNDFTYFLMGNLKFNQRNTLRMFINSNTENPSITRLQGIYDVSNAQMISRGNPDLNPSYSNRVNMHYVNSDTERGRTFMAMLSMQNTSDYITTSTTYNPTIEVAGDNGTTIYNPLQYTTYTNLDGYWSFNAALSYGLPVGFLKSNLNLNAGVNYNKTPTLINNTKNIASTVGYNAGLTLGSNISQNIDFTLSWNGSYYESENSLSTSGNANRYFNHTASGSLKLVLWGGFTFTASAAFNQYIGYTNDYNESYLLCNAFLGKKLFKNQQGEVLLGVNDIFNQNTSFARTTGSGYTQNSWNSVVGRYVSLQFNYNLRLFGKKGSKNISDYDTSSRRDFGAMPGGRPPGGMGGPQGMR